MIFLFSSIFSRYGVGILISAPATATRALKVLQVSPGGGDYDSQAVSLGMAVHLTSVGAGMELIWHIHGGINF